MYFQENDINIREMMVIPLPAMFMLKLPPLFKFQIFKFFVIHFIVALL